LPPNSWEYVHGFWNWECGVRHRLLESLWICLNLLESLRIS
jgi:hypothetical protein